MYTEMAPGRWEDVLELVRRNVTESRFNTWFSKLTPRKLTEQSLEIEAPTPFFVDYFEEHNLKVLLSAIREVFGWEPKVQFSVPPG